MNTQEAKEILAVFRPGMDDERDPLFAEALALVRGDTELNAWFAASLAFDKAMNAELANVVAPSKVREAILAERKIIRPVPWWERRLTRHQWSAAAAIVLV